MKYGDLQTADKYLKEYYEQGGTKTGFMRSIKLAHPLSGLPIKNRGRFIGELNPKQVETYKRAIEWYKNTYTR